MGIGTVGLLSPGEMGHTIGGVLRGHGLRVLTHLGGRSDRSRALAAKAGIEDTGSLDELVRAAANSDRLFGERSRRHCR